MKSRIGKFAFFSLLKRTNSPVGVGDYLSLD